MMKCNEEARRSRGLTRGGLGDPGRVPCAAAALVRVSGPRSAGVAGAIAPARWELGKTVKLSDRNTVSPWDRRAVCWCREIGE